MGEVFTVRESGHSGCRQKSWNRRAAINGIPACRAYFRAVMATRITMFGPMSFRLQLPAAILGAFIAGTLALLIATAPVHAASLQTELQERADRAALVGVNMLGT